jgi:hypothetical protein
LDENFPGDDLAHDPINAEGVQKYLKIEERRKIVKPVPSLQAAYDEDGSQADTQGNGEYEAKEQVAHRPGRSSFPDLRIYKKRSDSQEN